MRYLKVASYEVWQANEGNLRLDTASECLDKAIALAEQPEDASTCEACSIAGHDTTVTTCGCSCHYRKCETCNGSGRLKKTQPEDAPRSAHRKFTPAGKRDVSEPCVCYWGSDHGDDSPQPEDDEQAPEFRFEFRDGETMEKAAQRVHREAWYAGYRRKAEINRLAGIENTSQAFDRTGVEKSAATFAKKRWPDDAPRRQNFIAGAVYALDEAVGFHHATQARDHLIATDEQIERVADALANTNNDKLEDYENPRGVRNPQNPYRLEAYVALHAMGYKIPGLIDCVSPGACDGCPGCKGALV